MSEYHHSQSQINEPRTKEKTTGIHLHHHLQRSMRLLELKESYPHLFPSVYSEHHFISFVYNSPSDPEGKEHVFPELAHQFLLYKSFTVLE